jgi:hypothetical protein
MAHWQPLTDLQHKLAATLGTERYATVWERGARLNLDMVVAQLLAELADQ